MYIAKDTTCMENQPGAAAGEAATEADKADPAKHTKEVTLEFEEEEKGIDRGYSYSAESFFAEKAADKAEPITEGASTLVAEDSTQQLDSGQTCYPQRDT